MRNGVRYRRTGGLVATMMIAAVCWVIPSTARASSVLTSLPTGFGGIAVDAVHDQVFVSSPTSNTISVLDFAGNLVQTITGETGAGSMTVYGGNLYVALPSAIDVFDTSTLSRTATLASGQLSAPGPLVEAGGQLWTSSGACGNWTTQLVSVDPVTGLVKQWPTSTSSSLTYCIGLAASPYNPNLLLAWDQGLEPATITELDVSTGTPVQTASQWESDQGNLTQIAFNPDNSTFVTASGSPYHFDEFSLSNLTVDGVTYPAQPYPNSVVTTSARGGLIVGSSVTYANAVYAYHPGQPAADLFNPILPEPVYARGLALSPDGSELFAALQGSSSTVLDVLPIVASTTASLAAPSSNVAPGTPVSFTATVSATAGWPTPTGTVTFTSGTTQSTVQLVNGQASFTTSWSTAGKYEVSAFYNGDSNDATSSAYAIETVGTVTSTSLSSSANPAGVGQPVTFTATVTGTSPTGSVSFYDGANSPAAPTLLGSVTLSNANASLTVSNLAAGTHSITAYYSGDSANVSSNSNAVSEVINQYATSTQLATSSASVTYGQPVTFTATVTSTASSGTEPSGSVAFQIMYQGANTVLGTAQLSNGQATLTTSRLPGGTDNVVAVYEGDSYYGSSTSNTVAETVNPAPTTASVSSSANPATAGQQITFTATVSSGNASTGSVTGSVTFFDGSTTLITEQLSGGAASYTTSLSVGTHTISVSYSGSSSYQGSKSSALQETVDLAATSTTLTSSQNPAKSKTPVTFTATVTPSTMSTTLTGSVSYYFGSKLLATVPLSGFSSTYTTHTLPVGYDTITAVYSGNASFASSRAQVVEQIRH